MGLVWEQCLGSKRDTWLKATTAFWLRVRFPLLWWLYIRIIINDPLQEKTLLWAAPLSKNTMKFLAEYPEENTVLYTVKYKVQKG
jgi:hypothetical protein